MSGNYPDGVHENTRGAPWNQHAVETCSVCRREFYTDTEPDTPRADDMTDAPETAHGHTHTLCNVCECENDVCAECGENRLTLPDKTPRTLHGCASCRAVALPCLDCGADVTVCECDANAAQCRACGARQFVLLGTLRETSHYRCRNCGADHHEKQKPDACPRCGSDNWNGVECWNCVNGYAEKGNK